MRPVARTIATACISVTAVSAATAAMSAEHCKIDETLSAKNTNYTEQHVMEVGDLPGHQIRIFELKRVFPDDKPNCEGLKRTDSTTHAITDYLDRNGSLVGYTVETFENGDKMFMEVSGTSQTVTGSDGGKSGTFVGVLRITGGTGKYINAHGLIREKVNFDIAKNFNESRDEGEYWIDK